LCRTIDIETSCDGIHLRNETNDTTRGRTLKDRTQLSSKYNRLYILLRTQAILPISSVATIFFFKTPTQASIDFVLQYDVRISRFSETIFQTTPRIAKRAFDTPRFSISSSIDNYDKRLQKIVKYLKEERFCFKTIHDRHFPKTFETTKTMIFRILNPNELFGFFEINIVHIPRTLTASKKASNDINTIFRIQKQRTLITFVNTPKPS
jgi:hypothetical protein